MVKKYLCAAPHLSTWGDRAESLLKSLGGSKKQREKVLKQTLEQLAAEVAEKNKRTGPGRKSNADHAVNFYEYVLNLNNGEEKAKTTKKAEKKAEPSDPTPVAGVRKHTKTQRPKGEDDEASILSMTSQEFLDQHNDLCEVCNLGGDLLCCATCNLVFHMKCTRPRLKELPPDNWSCSYCVASGVTGYKKEARTRRRAAAAVRQMTKNKQEWKEKGSLAEMKEEEEPEEDAGEEEGDEKESPKKTTKDAPKEASKEAPKEAPKETPIETPKEAPKEAPKETPKEEKTADAPLKVEDAESRRARHRRPDDQSGEEEGTWCNFCKDDASIPVCCFCACRVCFGKHDWPNLLLCDHCDEEYHTYCLTPPIASVPTTKKWYCPTCKPLLKKEASATRSKVDTKNTPEKKPVSRPPNTEKKIVLPTKAPEVEKRPVGRPPHTEKKPAGKNPTTEKRPVGRPPNSDKRPVGRPPNTEKRPVGRPPNPEKRPVGRPPHTEKKPTKPKPKESPPAQAKRGPGRPRKHPLAPATTQPQEKRPVGRPPNPEKRPVGRPPSVEKKSKGKELAQIPVKRGPGRPRKHPLPTATAAATQKKSSTGRPRGRPPKNRPATLEPKPTPTRISKRARTVEDDEHFQERDSAAFTGAENAPAVPFSKVVQRSRSGRMVKQKTFHDELFEVPKRPSSASRSQNSAGRSSSQSKKSASKAEKTSESSEFVMSQAQILKLKSLMAPRSAAVSASLAGKSSLAPPVFPTPKPDPPPPGVVPEQPFAHNPDINATLSKASQANSKRPSGVIVQAVTIPPPIAAPTPLSTPSTSSPMFTPSLTVGQSVDTTNKAPRRKPGARECMQISRRFSTSVIPQRYMDILLNYCSRGKVEHLIRMRERLDDHSRFLEAQLAGLEAAVKEKGETDIVVPVAQETVDTTTGSTTTATAFPQNIRRPLSQKQSPPPTMKPAPNMKAAPTLNTKAAPIPTLNTNTAPVPISNMKPAPVPNSNIKHAPIMHKNTKTAPAPNSNQLAAPVPNSNARTAQVPNAKKAIPTINTNANIKSAPVLNVNTKAAPVSNANTKAVPVQNVNKKATPVSNTNMKAAPVQNVNMKAAPVSNPNMKAAPVQNVNTKAAPVSNTNTKAISTLNTSTKATPASNTNTKAAVVQNVNTKAAPVSNANTKATPVQNVNTKAAPASNVNMKAVPTLNTNTKAALVQKSSTKATHSLNQTTKVVPVPNSNTKDTPIPDPKANTARNPVPNFPPQQMNAIPTIGVTIQKSAATQNQSEPANNANLK